MSTSTSSGGPSAEADQIPHRRLPFWVALAMSVALVGPTLAMSGNGQGLITTVGKAIPLVFVIGLVGVSLVGYGFVRLTRHLNHAGSAYGLVGGTLALTAAFVNAFIANLQPGNDTPFQLPWPAVVAVGAVISFLLSGRDVRLLGKILLVIEGAGIVSMIVLVIVIFARGGAPATGIDLGAFSFDGVSSSAVISGVVAAFLSWAGFEACASMGEETDDPKRNIPRALAGTLILTGVLFVVVMFAQVVGFGTDAAGLEAFGSSGKTLGDLGNTYIGQWFSLLIIFTAIVAAFGCHLACSRRRAGCSTPSGVTVSVRRHWPRSTRAPAVPGSPRGWWSGCRWSSICSAVPPVGRTWGPATPRSTPTSCSPSQVRYA